MISGRKSDTMNTFKSVNKLIEYIEPDYSYGWSAEAYPKDLSFEATEGTINYICPCKKNI